MRSLDRSSHRPRGSLAHHELGRRRPRHEKRGLRPRRGLAHHRLVGAERPACRHLLHMHRRRTARSHHGMRLHLMDHSRRCMHLHPKAHNSCRIRRPLQRIVRPRHCFAESQRQERGHRRLDRSLPGYRIQGPLRCQPAGHGQTGKAQLAEKVKLISADPHRPVGVDPTGAGAARGADRRRENTRGAVKQRLPPLDNGSGSPAISDWGKRVSCISDTRQEEAIDPQGLS